MSIDQVGLPEMLEVIKEEPEVEQSKLNDCVKFKKVD